MHKSGVYRSVSMRITAWLNLLVLVGTCSCVAAHDVRIIAQKLQHRIDAHIKSKQLKIDDRSALLLLLRNQ